MLPCTFMSQGAPHQLEISKWPFAKVSACGGTRREQAGLFGPARLLAPACLRGAAGAPACECARPSSQACRYLETSSDAGSLGRPKSVEKSRLGEQNRSKSAPPAGPLRPRRPRVANPLFLLWYTNLPHIFGIRSRGLSRMAHEMWINICQHLQACGPGQHSILLTTFAGNRVNMQYKDMLRNRQLCARGLHLQQAYDLRSHTS